MRRQGVVAIAAEPLAAALQQPVQGAAGQLQPGVGQGGPQPGGGLAGGSGKVDAAAGLLRLHRRQHARHRAGFAGAGAALE
jgi:hypothetical protein